MDIYEVVTAFYNKASIEKKVIGTSLFGRNIYALKVGVDRPIGLVQYAIHGREFITARLAMAQYAVGVAKGSCWFVPLANPDGALLSEKGIFTAPIDWRNALIDMNKGADFSLWKANGRGVDLNVNFPAKWGEGSKNTRIAGAENYIGECPCSESETRVLKDFTETIRPDYTVSYHTKGEEIYWYFDQTSQTYCRDQMLARVLSKMTGYPLVLTKGSVGGYKDWCIQRFRIPAFTVEVGADMHPHPLGVDALPDIIEKNGGALYALSKEIKDS